MVFLLLFPKKLQIQIIFFYETTKEKNKPSAMSLLKKRNKLTDDHEKK